IREEGPPSRAHPKSRNRKMDFEEEWGLALDDIDGKGKGVRTTRIFRAGEVLCDYHGEVVTEEEGQNIHDSTEAQETGYMFFYKRPTGEKMCIDAHLHKCCCHPDRQTFGRRINHSRKHANIRPRLFRLNFESGDRDVMLFFATRDITEGEEILFNYGVNKKQFSGEGLDLEWLD
uniref:SET domain-containing protein n=1 Tax=Salarias fasciatus TaxID=181472 RepID=A0A672HXF2_SALFA